MPMERPKVTEVHEIEEACPYCGGDDLAVRTVHGQSTRGRVLKEIRHCVACGRCQSTGPLAKTKDEAIALFNRRADRCKQAQDAQASLFCE